MIHTERLVLRPFEAGDLPALIAYRSDPQVAAFQSWNSGFGPRDAERFLAEQRNVAFGQPGEWTQLAIVDRADGAVFGDCAAHISGTPPATAEIGITLAGSSQGRGIAAEALHGLLAALFDDHAVHRVYAEADDRNESVHRLLERIGMRLEGRLVEADWFKGEWTTLRIYALLAREWRARAHGLSGQLSGRMPEHTTRIQPIRPSRSAR